MMALQKETNPLVEGLVTAFVNKKKITTIEQTTPPNSTSENSRTLDHNQSATKLEKNELEVVVTKDKNLIDQYYKLRHESYLKEFNFPNYNGYENEFDRAGKIMITIIDGKVAGGMRFMFDNDKNLLSAEIENSQFNYRELLQSMDLTYAPYCEISAIVVAKEYRDNKIIEKMFDLLIDKHLKGRCKYLLGVSTSAHCRIYSNIAKRLGITPKINLKYPWIVREDHNNLKEFPIVVFI